MENILKLVQNPQVHFTSRGDGEGVAAPIPHTSSVNEPSPSLTQKFWLTENMNKNTAPHTINAQRTWKFELTPTGLEIT